METLTETKKALEIKEVAWPATTFIIKKQKVHFDELSEFFSQQYDAMYSALQKAGIVSSQAPFAFYYSVDEKAKLVELAAAIQLDDPNINVPGFETITLAPAKILTTKYVGSYESMGHVYEEMEKHMKEKGMQKKLMIEQYLSDPVKEKDSNKWETNVFFILR